MRHRRVDLKHSGLIAGGIAVAVLLLPAANAGIPVPISTTRVSVGSPHGNGDSSRAAVSADGRYLVFHSFASSLVPGDTNGATDVFLRDRQLGTTTLVSVSTGEVQGNGLSSVPTISADGRFVAFESGANNLVAGDTNGAIDIFVRDRQLGTTTRASVASGGGQANSASTNSAISADGRFVTFESDANNLAAGDTNVRNDVFVHHLQTGTTRRVSIDSSGAQGNDHSGLPSISGDGQVVAFASLADNLVAGDTNGQRDAFVHDVSTGATTRASVSSSEVEGNSFSGSVDVSDDGRSVAFASDVSNLISGDTNGVRDIFVRDRVNGFTERVSLGAGAQGNGTSQLPAISAAGRFVAFSSLASNIVAGDTNGVEDVFVRDRQAGTTTRLSVSANGSQANDLSQRAAISADGRFVGYESEASNLVDDDTGGFRDVFVRGLGATELVSLGSGLEANSGSQRSAVSADGRFVAFDSTASNLVAGDTNGAGDVFVHDRRMGETARVSIDSAGVQGNAQSLAPAIGADGRFVAFHSTATNLVPNDANGLTDVFVRDRQSGMTTRVSVDSAGGEATGVSAQPAISGDGRFVAFQSTAADLVAGDTNNATDVFVHDRQSGATTRVSRHSDGTQGNANSVTPALSADGSIVAFQSAASNLVAGDSNGADDVFAHQAGTTIRVSVGAGGAQGNGASFSPALSADGRFFAFHSAATNLVAGDGNAFTDVFVRDGGCGVTTRASLSTGGLDANGGSFNAAFSADGRFVAFRSQATNLTAGDTNGFDDVFVRDRTSAVTSRVSVDSSGAQANQASFEPALGGVALTVAFESLATNLVPADANGARDVFVHTRRVQPRRGVPTCGG